MRSYQRKQITSDATIDLSRYNKGEISELDAITTVESDNGISRPHDNDVLSGRGGNINIHPGNETFRRIVEIKKRVYLTAQLKSDKRRIADSVITTIKELHPPGRFLAKNPSTGLWYDVGYEKARDKTSQALRENAPSIRREIENEHFTLRTKIQMKREKLQIKEQEVRRAAERYYAPHHRQQHFDNDYHSKITTPSEYRQENWAENCSTSDTYPCTESGSSTLESSSHIYHATAHQENFSQYNDNGTIHNHSHPYANNGYQLPTDQDYAMQKKKQPVDPSRSVLPTSVQNLTPHCNAFNEVAEMAGMFWNSTTGSMDLSCNTSHSNEEPIRIGDEYNKPNSKQSRAHENEMRTPASPSSIFQRNATETMFNSFKHLTSEDDDILQNMEIEEISSVRHESNGSIGGQSLIHVFDGDSVRNREASEMSML